MCPDELVGLLHIPVSIAMLLCVMTFRLVSTSVFTQVGDVSYSFE
jgi:hypothetical protein